MYTLIAFATQWGSKYGGINSFNADFLTAFGVAYHQNAQIVCIVTEAKPEAVEEAARAHVTLLPLPYVPAVESFDSSIGESGVDLIRQSETKFDPQKTIWVGHDLITGEAAIAAAKHGGGRAAVIHHMSYRHYESYAEDSQSALTKTEHQTAILGKADLVLAIGPLLRDAAIDRLGGLKQVHMLIPGLPEIDPQEAPKTFVAFLSGRLSADAARVKQGHLGIAAFAEAEREARSNGVPDALRKEPQLLLRGVDFENKFSQLSPTDVESDLKKFAEEQGKAVINLHALPYTEDRQQLYTELSRSTVALMPSWHEGFGLVAWEAIAAGVPLILGQNSGVFRYLEEKYPGTETGYVESVDIMGKIDFPFFRDEDLKATVNALRIIAADSAKARKKASSLRNLLLEENSWVSCCEDVMDAFGWDLQRGSLADRSNAILQQITEPIHTSIPPADTQSESLKIPQKQWRAGKGMADSQLLRAEEALLPFDPGREGDVQKLGEWTNDPTLPLTIRLITGPGGQGKTRLAIHLCEQMRTSGWCAGFLDSNLDPSGLKSLWAELRSLGQPILIVVDYAETRQAAFLALLKMALKNSLIQPVRMLLLARDSGEWWDNLPSRDSDCEALLIGSATTGPFPLAALYTTQQQRQSAFNKALRAFANVLDVSTPNLTPDLAGDQFERPLFVQMAALLALYGESPVTAQGLTRALLNHERRYWVRLLEPLNWPDGGQRAEQILALATLAGGFPTARIAEMFWTAAKGSVLTTGEFNSLFRSMATLYPGTHGLQALRPDLLGEALVAQVLLRPEGDVLLDAVLGSSASQLIRSNALTVLARLTNERVDVDEIIVAGLLRQFPNSAAEVVAVAVETVSRLPELAGIAFEQMVPAIKNQLVGSLVNWLPDQSVQLAALSCLVFGHQVERAREKLAKKPANVDRMFECALALDKHGVSLSYIGNYSKACETGAEGVNLFRRLLTKDRNRFESTYAGILGNYSNNLYRSGRFDEAMAIELEVLEIYERLNKKEPTRFANEYATILNNYAISLSDVGQTSEALLHSQAGMDIVKRLIVKAPDRYEPDYARLLDVHATLWDDAGNPEQAIFYSSQALDIRNRLALRTPDRFEPERAISLNNHAYFFTNVGEYKKALVYAREALQIRRRLVQRIPQAFARDFLISKGLFDFLAWLGGGNGAETNDDVVASALAALSAHHENLIQFFLDFVRGCKASDADVRTDCFVYILSIWSNLSRSNRRILEPFRLCAAAWSSRFEILVDEGWQEDWERYSTQRNGNLPRWMFEVARRLDFPLPDLAQ